MKPTPLKRVLFDRGLRLTDLQKMTGVNYDNLSMIANGRRPNLETALKIARALGTTVEALWGYLLDKENKPEE